MYTWEIFFGTGFPTISPNCSIWYERCLAFYNCTPYCILTAGEGMCVHYKLDGGFWKACIGACISFIETHDYFTWLFLWFAFGINYSIFIWNNCAPSWCVQLICLVQQVSSNMTRVTGKMLKMHLAL